jgi:hypothetical protein
VPQILRLCPTVEALTWKCQYLHVKISSICTLSKNRIRRSYLASSYTLTLITVTHNESTDRQSNAEGGEIIEYKFRNSNWRRKWPIFHWKMPRMREKCRTGGVRVVTGLTIGE